MHSGRVTHDAASWQGTVELPDRTPVRGRGVQDRLPGGLRPDFGLYLGVDYAPEWEHERLDWPEFRVPRSAAHAATAIEEAYLRARDGERVEVACRAGRGRTGTVIACMAILAGLESAHAVSWTRSRYEYRAVETPWQRRWVRRFPVLLARAREDGFSAGSPRPAP